MKKLNFENVDFKGLSEATGISIVRTKMILGLPLDGECNATTASEARTAYEEAEDESELKEVCLEKWRELAADEIEATTTREEFENAVKDAPQNDPETDEVIEEKETEFALKEIESATTQNELDDIYQKAPDNKDVTEAYEAKSEEFDSDQDLEDVEDLDELKDILNNAEEGSYSEMNTLKKLAILHFGLVEEEEKGGE